MKKTNNVSLSVVWSIIISAFIIFLVRYALPPYVIIRVIEYICGVVIALAVVFTCSKTFE